MASVTLDTITRSRLSSEPIRVPVYASVNGAIVNPTTMAVAMAFKLEGAEPAGVDWIAGTWDTSATYKAQVTPPVLAVGTYVVWLRLTGTDVPVRIVGYLKLV